MENCRQFECSLESDRVEQSCLQQNDSGEWWLLFVLESQLQQNNCAVGWVFDCFGELVATK